MLGSGLSPNGVGFSDEGMMSMALLDGVLWVDPNSMQVGLLEQLFPLFKLPKVVRSHMCVHAYLLVVWLQ